MSASSLVTWYGGKLRSVPGAVLYVNGRRVWPWSWRLRRMETGRQYLITVHVRPKPQHRNGGAA